MRRHRAAPLATLTIPLTLSLALGACARSTPTTPAPSASPPSSAQSTAPGDGSSSADPGGAEYPDTAEAPSLSAGRPAWVAVSVATLWRTPTSPRAVDAPALAAPARIGRWLGDMSVEERRELSGRADTQALLGDQVVVVRLRARWARVVVPSQPSPQDARGYPGWVPRRQLTATRPTVTDHAATVTRRTAWLRDDEAGRRLYRVSFGTEFPVLSEDPTFVRVVAPTGRVLRLDRAVVTVHDPGAAALDPSQASLVRIATSFRGLPYLWAGASGFGLDCSGLVWLSYRVHGIPIPRDASPQSQDGTPVPEPRPGDLLFYARSGVVHHVAMFLGAERMVHAPNTGDVVKVSRTSSPQYADEFAGAGSYLP